MKSNHSVLGRRFYWISGITFSVAMFIFLLLDSLVEYHIHGDLMLKNFQKMAGFLSHMTFWDKGDQSENDLIKVLESICQKESDILGIKISLSHKDDRVICEKTKAHIFWLYPQFLDHLKPFHVRCYSQPLAGERGTITFAFRSYPLTADFYHSFVILVFMVIFLMVVMMGMTSWSTRRYLSQPIYELKNSINLISQGDFSHPIYIDQKDELGELARCFEDMRHKIQHLVHHLQYMNENLENKVKFRTQELENANNFLEKALSQADQINETRKLFLANMSHEIRTPLNGVIGLTQLLEQTKLDEEQCEYALKIKSSSHVLLDLLNDILDQVKIENHTLILTHQWFYLAHILKSLYDVMGMQAAEKKINFVIEMGFDVPFLLWGDEVRVRQILINLVSNAIKFTSQGAIVVKVIKPKQHHLSDWIQFQVSDTGIGIDEQNYQKIFQPFHQVDSSLTRVHHGSGLGLSIVKHLVELMQGDISCQSQLGKGSCFFVDIPFKVKEIPEKIDPMFLKNISCILFYDSGTERDKMVELFTSFGAHVKCVQRVDDMASLKFTPSSKALLFCQGAYIKDFTQHQIDKILRPCHHFKACIITQMNEGRDDNEKTKENMGFCHRISWPLIDQNQMLKWINEKLNT